MSIIHKNKFSSNNRIKKRKFFLEIQESGEKLFTNHFLIFVRESKDNRSKIGITISKKIDKRAVVRNKLKRRLREFFRTSKKYFNKKYEMIIIGKKNSKDINFHEIHRELTRLFYLKNIFNAKKNN